MFRITPLLIVLIILPGTLAAPALPEQSGKAAIDAAWTVFAPADLDTTIRFRKEILEEPKDRPPRVEVDEKGKITLRSYGMLISREPRGPVTISFKWKWAEREGDVAKFGDHVAVGLRLAGPPGVKMNYQITDGLVVSLILTTGGKVVIDVRQPQGGGLRIQELADNPLQFKRGIEYSVKIVDEGEKIRVVLDDKEVASAKVPAGKGLVAIYSRPPFGGPTVAVLRGLRADVKK